MSKVITRLCVPIQREFPHFCALLFLSLVSSSSYFIITRFQNTFDLVKESSIVCTSFSILFVYLILLVLLFIRRSKHPLLPKIFLTSVYTLFLGLIMFELITALVFGKYIYSEILDIILSTNPAETGEFMDTYLSKLPLPLAIFLVVLMLGISIRKGTQNYKVPDKLAFLFVLALLPALMYIAINARHYAKKGFVKGSYRSTAITRFIGESIVLKKTYNQMGGFTLTSRPETIQYISKEIQCSNIVVIIGESFSKYHSSLYSYPKVTNPKLGELAQSNLYVYNDVVTLFNYTIGALKTIYGISGHSSNKTPPPPFPSVLRGARYKTHLLDYQRDYLTGKKYQTVWDNMFANRNMTKFSDDMELINTMDVSKAEPTLYVLNLMGQHCVYANRYPESFAHFQRSDYPEVSNSQHAEILAHYDNATLYNDFVIYNAIQKLLDKEAVLLYFSDHGEEIYDYRNFMGHAALSERSKHIKYQVEVPFMIWVSDLYKENHPDKVEQIKNAVDRPYNTGDLVHLIMDISGIKAEGYDPTKSVINEQFDSTHDRIVLGYLNYDQRRREGQH